MAETFYAVTAFLSIVFVLIYAFAYHKHFDVHITLLFVLIPINNFGQLFLCRSKDVELALLANKFIYISACYSILMITLVVFSLCDIKLNKYIRLLLYLISTTVFFFTLQIGENELYYKSVKLVRVDGGTTLIKEYGPLHKYFYIMVLVYFAMGIIAIGYSYFKKNQVSRRFIYLLALPEVLAVFSFFIGRKLTKTFDFLPDVELIPLAYDIAMIVYLIIVHRLVLYDISDTVIDSVVQKGETGFISFDFKYRYLGSNETAKKIFPELSTLTVDKDISASEQLSRNVNEWLSEFKNNNQNDKFYYKTDDKTYLVDVNFLSDGNHKRGYQLYITDDTKNQQYIALLDSFNTELKQEVAEKTQHIIEMHDNLILSMATMVESRDNSTGGHIRRTSEGVRILIDEIRKGSDFELDDEFCKNIIKAAPMHDLGKIAVDDAILRKPGRFNDEEYAIMKTHAAEGARIVHEILKGTDDERFRVIAENVAHYHHERIDGSGYPEGLKGEQIPLEARIMAIADVYDALVSKRVYKEKMSFEQADKIITEGMGKHFDKRLEPYYIAARPKLESYYSTAN
ncbi:MAG: HD domain-containing protein [Ruminococcus sp.]|nr:HD domain-containing protein [Ruminococcus sp.]